MRRTLALLVLPALALAACGKDTDTTTIRGENGETVTIETPEDGDGVTTMEAVNDKGEKVTASINSDGAAWPADAPPYAAAYPGAKPTTVMNSDSGGTRGSIVTFEAADAAAKVVDHYKALASKAGLGETSTMTSGETSIFTAADKATGREFFVQATTADGKTQGSVTFATKTPA